MPKLFVDKTIIINAPTGKVWEILTKPENSDAWAAEFSSGGPRFRIESDWQLGGEVLWKGDDGTVIVEGKVTALEPNKLLRYTVADTRSAKVEMSEEDGITFELTEQNRVTTLHLLHGDFSVIPDNQGAKFRDLSAQIWDRVLPLIKKLAEA
jgi:uncharacterized protein YndB with AHSA1/START domain